MDRATKAVTSLPTHFLFGGAFKDIRRLGFYQWAKQNVLVKSIALILVGVFLIIATDYFLTIATKVVFVVMTVIEIVFSVKQFHKNRWQIFNVRYRMYLCISMIIICVVVLLRDQALFILGSVLFGVLALIFTFLTLDAAINSKDDSIWKRVIHFFESAVSAAYGISFLIIPSENVFKHVWGVGISLIIDGVFRLVIAYVPYFRKTSPRRTLRKH